MDPIIFGLVVVVALNMLMFPIAFKLQTDKLTDITYAVSFSCIAIYGFFMGVGMKNVSKMVVAALVLLWAIRLGAFLFYRVGKMGKDDRFDQIRTNPRRFFRFFLLQGVSSWIISLPFLFLLIHNAGAGKGWSDVLNIEWIGWAIALIGLIIEAVADQQKSNFKFQEGNKHVLYTKGLYSFVRYPNYLGEILFWIGLFLASTPSMIGLRWLSFLSPVIIIVLLVFVTGLPPIEKSRNKKYKDDAGYQKYKSSTSKLIPGIF